MASSYDFFITGDQNAARNQFAHALTEQGFSVEPTPAGGLVAKRGSMKKTMWLGAFAGKDFHVAFIVEYFTDAQGRLVARLNRNMAGGALKGGAIGTNKVENAFVETVDAVSATLSSAGVLADRVTN